MTDVFISYGREAAVEGFVHKLKRDLEDTQLSVWLDVDLDGILAGEKFPRELEIALRNCKALIAVLTKKYVASKWCPKELLYAIGKNKRIFPIIREEEWNDESMEGVDFMICDYNWVSFLPSDDYDAALQKLVVGLKTATEQLQEDEQLQSDDSGEEQAFSKHTRGDVPHHVDNSWYHGNISSWEAEKRLKAENSDCFLVRRSQTQPENYSLSVRCKGVVRHFLVHNKRNKPNNHEYYEVDGTDTQFGLLEELVDYYKYHCVSAKGEKLTTPCANPNVDN